MKDSKDLRAEIALLNKRVTDLVNQYQRLEEKMREDWDSLVDRLHWQTAECSTLKPDKSLKARRLKTANAKLPE